MLQAQELSSHHTTQCFAAFDPPISRASEYDLDCSSIPLLESLVRRVRPVTMPQWTRQRIQLPAPLRLKRCGMPSPAFVHTGTAHAVTLEDTLGSRKERQAARWPWLVSRTSSQVMTGRTILCSAAPILPTLMRYRVYLSPNSCQGGCKLHSSSTSDLQCVCLLFFASTN